jgi:hypothetical protein
MTTKSLLFLLSALFLSAGTERAAPTNNDASAIVSHIPREHVQSSGLVSVGYSKRRHILEIEFLSGSVYRYVDVPPSVYRDLVSAESKTGYYASHIKRNYRSVRVRPRIKDIPVN